MTEDEAYYRLWAQQLHFGYYDHPPMIAWWIRGGVTLAGDNPLGVRLLPVIATGLVSALIGDLAHRLGARPATVLRSVVWYNATITIGIGGILATPDAPATFFWVLTLWCLVRTTGPRPARWWAAAGLAVGLATISKYSALFLAPGAFLWLWLSPDGKARLKTPWPWIAALLAGAVFATNVAWNAQHGWLTFAKQFGRVEPSGFSPTHLGELLVSQFLLLNPVIAIYAFRGLQLGWRNRNNAGDTDLRLPLATTLPFAAYLMLHSLHDRVQGHWPAPIFAALVICAAVAAERGSAPPALRAVRNLAIAFSLCLSAAALAYMAAPHSRALGTFDPILPLRGWREFSVAVDQKGRQESAGWIGVVSYGTLAQLSAEGLVTAPLLQITERTRYLGLPPPRPDFRQPGLVVDLARRLEPRDLLRCFSHVASAGDLDRGAREPGPAARYRAYLVSGPKVDVMRVGCPDDPAMRRKLWR
nr:glycosyltransferase family 39 protein [Phenylobacterium glaciei]